jgi:hypothetical protein
VHDELRPALRVSFEHPPCDGGGRVVCVLDAEQDFVPGVVLPKERLERRLEGGLRAAEGLQYGDGRRRVSKGRRAPPCYDGDRQSAEKRPDRASDNQYETG